MDYELDLFVTFDIGRVPCPECRTDNPGIVAEAGGDNAWANVNARKELVRISADASTNDHQIG